MQQEILEMSIYVLYILFHFQILYVTVKLH